MITSPQNLKIKKKSIYVFCAGPIQGAPDWQAAMPNWSDVTFINPRREKSALILTGTSRLNGKPQVYVFVILYCFGFRQK